MFLEEWICLNFHFSCLIALSYFLDTSHSVVIFSWYHRRKINGNTPKVPDWQKNCSEMQLFVMKFDKRNKFDLCHYSQVNSLWLKSSVTSKWAIKHFWGCHLLTFVIHLLFIIYYFADDGTSHRIVMFSCYFSFASVILALHYLHQINQSNFVDLLSIGNEGREWINFKCVHLGWMN